MVATILIEIGVVVVAPAVFLLALMWRGHSETKNPSPAVADRACRRSDAAWGWILSLENIRPNLLKLYFIPLAMLVVYVVALGKNGSDLPTGIQIALTIPIPAVAALGIWVIMLGPFLLDRFALYEENRVTPQALQAAENRRAGRQQSTPARSRGPADGETPHE